MGERASEVARDTSYTDTDDTSHDVSDRDADAMGGDTEGRVHHRAEAFPAREPEVVPAPGIVGPQGALQRVQETTVAPPRAATGGADHEDHADADLVATRHYIEETRNEIADTIDAIKERLSPQHLVAEARGAVLEAATERVTTVEQRVGDVIETARRAVEPSLHAVSQQLRVAGNRAAAAGRVAVGVTRRQPVLATLALCGLALLWLNSRPRHAPPRR